LAERKRETCLHQRLKTKLGRMLSCMERIDIGGDLRRAEKGHQRQDIDERKSIPYGTDGPAARKEKSICVA